MTEAGDILDLLGLSPEPPGPAFLGKLFEAFVTRVPFESVSKIERAAEIKNPDEGPVTTAEFWAAHRERGAGGICYSRTFAFGELCRALKFSARYLLGAIGGPRSHAALLVDVGGRILVTDVGFPLPAIYALEDGILETPQGAMRLSEGGWRVDFPGTPMADTRIRFEPGGASDEDLREAWIASFTSPTYFSREVVLHRRIDSRIMRFARGELTILDGHSKLRLPLTGDRAAILSNLFEMEEGPIARALARTGDPEPAIAEAELASYLDSPDSAALLRFVSTPDGYRRWASGLGEAAVIRAGERSLSVTIKSAAGDAVEDNVSIAADGSLEIVRSGGLSRTSLSVLETPAGPHLVRKAVLSNSPDDLLRSDLARGRIAGLLAMDLVALVRLLKDETLVVTQNPKARIP